MWSCGVIVRCRSIHFIKTRMYYWLRGNRIFSVCKCNHKIVIVPQPSDDWCAPTSRTLHHRPSGHQAIGLSFLCWTFSRPNRYTWSHIMLHQAHRTLPPSFWNFVNLGGSITGPFVDPSSLHEMPLFHELILVFEKPQAFVIHSFVNCGSPRVIRSWER